MQRARKCEKYSEKICYALHQYLKTTSDATTTTKIHTPRIGKVSGFCDCQMGSDASITINLSTLFWTGEAMKTQIYVKHILDRTMTEFR